MATFFILFVIMLLISFSAAIMVDPLMYWTHRKGYQTPGWKALVVLPLFLGIIGTIGVGVYSMDSGLFLLTFVPAPAALGLSLLILRLLPKRKIRMGGSRKSRGVPYAVIGYVVPIVLGIMVVLGLLLKIELSEDITDSLADAIKVIPVAIAFSGMMFYLVRRAKTPTVEQALASDQRPPLLYLRSFDQETGRFVEVSPEAASKYSEIRSYQRTQLSHNLTLEQFLGREIRRRIGPFIALGNPTDYLPPEGASRTYAADGNWQQYFTDLSDRSAGILMQIGNSDNLNWELSSIKQRGLQTKLFVVTSPMSEADEDPYSVTRIVTQLTDRIKGIQPASWSKFAANLERTGYHPPQDPGAGAVVTYDRSMHPIKLVSGAKTPEEYVGAITGWLEKAPENGAKRRAAGKAASDPRRTERDRVEKYGMQIVVCPSCGTKNSLSFANCINCSKDLSREKPVANPYL